MENLLNYVVVQRYPLLMRYAGTVVIVGAFLLLRLQMGQTAGVYGFFVFIPAIFLASILFDRGCGLIATALSTVAILFIVEPKGELLITRRHLIPVGFFVVEAVGITVVCEALRRALERATGAEHKNALMFQELAHRIKNNLHMMGGLLALQAHAHKDDPALKAALDAAIARIQVMATVHDRLQPGGEEGMVNLRDYLAEFCDQLGESLRGLRPVTVRVDAEPILTTAEKAVPLGLIVNELVTNAFKYAFPGGQGGVVDVVLRRIEEDVVELIVRDDGIGCTTLKEGIGSRTVRLLANGLGGSVTRCAVTPGCLVTARLKL